MRRFKAFCTNWVPWITIPALVATSLFLIRVGPGTKAYLASSAEFAIWVLPTSGLLVANVCSLVLLLRQRASWLVVLRVAAIIVNTSVCAYLLLVLALPPSLVG